MEKLTSAATSAMALREYVLRAISDDYEEFEKIFEDVSARVGKSGTSVSRLAIQNVLESVIQEGYAQAYVLNARPSGAEPVSYSESELNKLWFYVTPDGKRLAQELSKNWN